MELPPSTGVTAWPNSKQWEANPYHVLVLLHRTVVAGALKVLNKCFPPIQVLIMILSFLSDGQAVTSYKLISRP